MKFPKLSPCLLHKQEKSDILLIIGADIYILICGDAPDIYKEIEVAFFISIHPDVQEQRKDDEREGRRKGDIS